MTRKKVVPVRKDSVKADFRLLSLIASNNGTKATHAKNSRSNSGKDRMSNRAERRDNAIAHHGIEDILISHARPFDKPPGAC